RGLARGRHALTGLRGESQQEKRVGIALFRQRLGEIDPSRVATFPEGIERGLRRSFRYAWHCGRSGGLGTGRGFRSVRRGSGSENDSREGKGEQEGFYG